MTGHVLTYSGINGEQSIHFYFFSHFLNVNQSSTSDVVFSELQFFLTYLFQQ